MATTRIMPLHVGKGRTESRAISDIIDYVANPKKTDNGRLITGYACDSRTADAEFLLAKRQYIAATGRVRGADDVIAYHVRQSFRPGEITPEEANRLGVEFAKRFTKGNHAFVVCTHIDKSHIHNHIIWSSVSLEYDRKFRNFWGSTKAVRQLSDTICIENGLSIVENPKPRSKGDYKNYGEWLQNRERPLNFQDKLRLAIDTALAKRPGNLAAFLSLMEQAGYEVKKVRGGGLSFRLAGQGQERFTRCKTLGEAYTQEAITERIKGRPVLHKPNQDRKGITLLIDIQNSLKAQQSAGYERWAKLHNLKQAAKTMNFITEHKIDTYADLESRVAEITAANVEAMAALTITDALFNNMSARMDRIHEFYQR